MSSEERIQGGLDILRREARYCVERSWRKYQEIMRQAEEHVTACGGSWETVQTEFSQEITELLEL